MAKSLTHKRDPFEERPEENEKYKGVGRGTTFIIAGGKGMELPDNVRNEVPQRVPARPSSRLPRPMKYCLLALNESTQSQIPEDNPRLHLCENLQTHILEVLKHILNPVSQITLIHKFITSVPLDMLTVSSKYGGITVCYMYSLQFTKFYTLKKLPKQNLSTVQTSWKVRSQ
jgi:hypothetical protein